VCPEGCGPEGCALRGVALRGVRVDEWCLTCAVSQTISPGGARRRRRQEPVATDEEVSVASEGQKVSVAEAGA